MEELRILRKKIDSVDKKILMLLVKRIELVKKIGEYKRKVGKVIVDKKREKEKIDRLEIIGKKHGIKREAIEKAWKAFFEIAYLQQK